MEKRLEEVTREVGDFYQKITKYISMNTPDISPMWRNIMLTTQKIINSPNLFDKKLQEIHRWVLYSLQHKPEVLRYQTDWWLNFLKNIEMPIESFPTMIAESEFVNSEFCTAIAGGGQRITPDFLRRLTHVAAYIRRHYNLPHYRFNVLELGAGYGGFARTFRLFYPNHSYFIIDIPDTLYFSAGFIKLNFPDAKVLLVSSEEDYLNKNPKEYDFIFIPIGLEHILHGETFDLFVNTHSLGEMQNHTIIKWFDFIQNKVKIKRTYMLNRFLNRLNVPNGQHRLNENRCSVIFDALWNIKYWEFEPPFMRCPFTETPENQCVLVMAERNENAADDMIRKNRSDYLFENVSYQDWFQFVKSYNPFYSTSSLFTKPERVQDFTMNGTLFNLWESIRLNENRNNIAAMLSYMKYINLMGPEFEEYYYYLERYSSLG